MKSLRVEVDRLNVTLDGFPTASAEEAMAGFEHQLQSALERVSWSAPAGPQLIIRDVTIPPLEAPVDAAALRAAIVDRLVDEIRRAAYGNQPEAS